MKLSPEDITYYLVERLQNASQGIVGRARTHTVLQRTVSQAAEHFGLRHVTDYRLHNPFGDGYSRYIDIVWFEGSKLVAAFELDSSLRVKSIRKLLAVQAEYKFWIYYGNRTPDSFISDLDTTESITVINLTSSRSFKVEESPQDSFDPSEIPSIFEDENISLPSLVAPYQKDFANLKDVGTQYTKSLLAKISTANNNSSESISSDLIIGNVESSTYHERLNKIKQRYPMAYECWTEHADNELEQLHHQGMSVVQLASVFQRQPSAIRSRLRKLGLMQ